MEILEQITANIKWYDENYADCSIDNLLSNRDKLAILSFNLAELCAEAKKEYNGKRFIKKIEFSRQKQEFMTKDFTASRADVEATQGTEMQYREELEAEAIGFKYDLLLRQLNKILEAMNQRLSHLKKEQELSRTQT